MSSICSRPSAARRWRAPTSTASARCGRPIGLPAAIALRRARASSSSKPTSRSAVAPCAACGARGRRGTPRAAASISGPGVVDVVAEDVQFARARGAPRRPPRSRPRARRARRGARPPRSPPTTPLIVSWSDSASSSTPASAARFDDLRRGQGAVGVGRVRLQVEARRDTARSVCDRIRSRRARAGRRRGRAERASLAMRACDRRAQAAHGVVVAVRLLVQRAVAVRRWSLRASRRSVGLGRPQAVRRATAPRGRRSPRRAAPRAARRPLELAQDGHHLGDQPALLAVGAQQQADVGGVVEVDDARSRS